jgi:hypothetical protein
LRKELSENIFSGYSFIAAGNQQQCLKATKKAEVKGAIFTSA